MPPEIFWIDTPAPGRLAVILCPAGGRALEGELMHLRDAGVDALVSMLEPGEASMLDLQDEGPLCAKHRMAFESLPTRDRGFPASVESAAALFDRMAAHLRAGRTVALHCRFAMGRSPLAAACVLVRLGKSAEEAIGILSAARGCIVPQLPEQQDWVRAFAALPGPP